VLELLLQWLRLFDSSQYVRQTSSQQLLLQHQHRSSGRLFISNSVMQASGSYCVACREALLEDTGNEHL
jgi:hypothetical protein